MSVPATASIVPAVAGADIEVIVEDDRWFEHPDLLQNTNRAIEALLNSQANGLDKIGAATILLANDANIAALNTTFRGKPVPTNVLSFPTAVGKLPSGAPAYAGDVIIARETVEREASEMGIPVIHHLQHLVVHGLLHLVGYDHTTDAEAAVMEGLETRILAAIGIADPYAD